MKPFRFGVAVSRAGSRAEWRDKARRIEDLGYSTLTVADHLTELLSPMPAVVSAAEATTRLRIGTGVLNNDFRHPVLLAREAATVDVLTDGRLQLGLGAGYMKSEYDQAGFPYDVGSVRVDRLAESVSIIRRLLDGESVTFEGRYYRITNHTIHPRPLQRPHPPILIGGSGPRLLALAAKEADIVALSGITFTRGGTAPDVTAWHPDVVDERVRSVRDAAGDHFDRLELNALVQQVVLTDDRRKTAEELARGRRHLTPPPTAELMLETPYMLIGTVDQMVEDLRARRKRWGISYYMTHEPSLEALAPVVARLAGS